MMNLRIEYAFNFRLSAVTENGYKDKSRHLDSKQKLSKKCSFTNKNLHVIVYVLRHVILQNTHKRLQEKKSNEKITSLLKNSGYDLFTVDFTGKNKRVYHLGTNNGEWQVFDTVLFKYSRRAAMHANTSAIQNKWGS
ncbi:hypothetical protein AVEN_135439-1 [Araneus ventricosus]|uniref:Uncharacterized protein n=1 Tax=Araneus ventricosus TaxID=182803 RepID=A0A4Y2BDI7_ARAVE|nr:hypothetical protein AVEN_135439-1 [Araneus ventricosus]